MRSARLDLRLKSAAKAVEKAGAGEGDPMPRFRFTIRRMMVAVTVGAVLVAVPLVRHRRFRSIALGHRLRAGREWVQSGGMSKAREAWYTGIIQKYERAARYPWLPVEPDPPEPE